MIIFLQKDQELARLKEELVKFKDEESSQSVKVKWAQNKLKQELESHKVILCEVRLILFALTSMYCNEHICLKRIEDITPFP